MATKTYKGRVQAARDTEAGRDYFKVWYRGDYHGDYPTAEAAQAAIDDNVDYPAYTKEYQEVRIVSTILVPMGRDVRTHLADHVDHFDFVANAEFEVVG